MTVRTVRRLNWGCGPCIAPGWINADALAADGIDLIGDIRCGLALDSGSLDYIVAIHVLQDLPYTDIPTALRELKRVLAPGGILRLGLPDLDKAIRAYLAEDHGYFYVPDADAERIGTKLVTQMIWYGSVRTPFTFDCIEEWLIREGYRNVRRCDFKQTKSPYPEIVELDNRPRESLFVEAAK
jgi:predicted SAM-dependent methyltransferase